MGERGRRERKEEGEESWWAGCSVEVNSGPGQPGQKEKVRPKIGPSPSRRKRKAEQKSGPGQSRKFKIYVKKKPGLSQVRPTKKRLAQVNLGHNKRIEPKMRQVDLVT